MLADRKGRALTDPRSLGQAMRARRRGERDDGQRAPLPQPPRPRPESPLTHACTRRRISAGGLITAEAVAASEATKAFFAAFDASVARSQSQRRAAFAHIGEIGAPTGGDAAGSALPPANGHMQTRIRAVIEGEGEEDGKQGTQWLRQADERER